MKVIAAPGTLMRLAHQSSDAIIDRRQDGLSALPAFWLSDPFCPAKNLLRRRTGCGLLISEQGNRFNAKEALLSHPCSLGGMS